MLLAGLFLPPGQSHGQESNGAESSSLGDQYLAAAEKAMKLGDREHAEAFLRRAIGIHEKTLGPSHRYVGLALSWLGHLYADENRYPEAEAAYKRALPIFLATLGPNHIEYAKVYNNLGEIYRQQGRYTEAEPIFKECLRILEQAYGPDSLDIAPQINSLAVINTDLGNMDEAEKLTKRVLAIRMNKLGPKNPDVGMSLHNLGFVYLSEAKYHDAEDTFQNAVDLWKKVYRKDVPASSGTYAALGTAYAADGHYPEAEANYRKALTAVQTAKRQPEEFLAQMLCDLGDTLQHENRNDEAFKLISSSLPVLQKFWGAGHPTALECLDHLVSIETSTGKTDAALEAARQAVRFRIERIATATKGRIGGDTIEQKSGRVSFTALLALLAQQPASTENTDEAFKTAQYAAGSSTAQAVAGMAARYAAGSDELAGLLRNRQDLLGRWQATNKALSERAAQAATAQDIEAEAHLRTDENDIESRLAKVDRDLTARFPQFKELSSVNPVSVGDVQSVLAPNEALISWTVAPEATYAFVLRKTQAIFYSVPMKAKELATIVASLRQGLDPAMQQDTSFSPMDVVKSYDLYTSLLRPAEALIVDADNLVIVPDGALQSLPPSVLVTKRPDGPIKTLADYKSIAWLIRSHALTVEPAISSLVALRRYLKQAAKPDSFIGFGNPDFQGTDEKHRSVSIGALYKSGSAVIEQLRRLQKLPETADELQTEAKAFAARTAKVYLGEEASVSKVKSLDLSHTSVLVFATHGLVAGDLPILAEPALALTPPANPSEEDDGLLRASEVSQLKLNADFVVLSACNTAAADGTPGAQALSGLAKAFFYAGAHSILVSHWMVDSDATVKLTTGTFKALAADPSIGRAQALRQSILKMIDTSDDKALDADPSAWAPFVLVGEGAG